MIKIKILYFGIGAATCFVGLFLIAYISDYRDPYIQIREHPRRFGDVKIAAFKPKGIQKEEDVGETLMMTKDNLPFFYASTNKSGKVTEIAILGSEEQIRFSMFVSESTGEWERAMYGKNDPEYTDINFDGQFDIKKVYDANGIKKSVWIFIDGDWHKVNGANCQIAREDSIFYRFDPNTGWLQNDANVYCFDPNIGWLENDANVSSKNLAADVNQK